MHDDLRDDAHNAAAILDDAAMGSLDVADAVIRDTHSEHEMRLHDDAAADGDYDDDDAAAIALVVNMSAYLLVN
jgi:hypothetical protein